MKFPEPAPEVLATPSDLWFEITQKPEFIARKSADEISDIWDRLIDVVVKDPLTNNLEPGSSLTDAEGALRIMAQENGFSRRMLGDSFTKFLDLPITTSLARIVESPSGLGYVFLAASRYRQQSQGRELDVDGARTNRVPER